MSWWFDIDVFTVIKCHLAEATVLIPGNSAGRSRHPRTTTVQYHNQVPTPAYIKGTKYLLITGRTYYSAELYGTPPESKLP